MKFKVRYTYTPDVWDCESQGNVYSGRMEVKANDAKMAVDIVLNIIEDEYSDFTLSEIKAVYINAD